MNLLEDYDDKGFTYERGSIILKGYFFQQTHKTEYYIYFQDYELDFMCCLFNNLVCASQIKLIQVT